MVRKAKLRRMLTTVERIKIDKTDGGLVKRKVDGITDIVHKDLSTLQHAEGSGNIPEKSLAEYKKRKLVEEKTAKRYIYLIHTSTFFWK